MRGRIKSNLRRIGLDVRKASSARLMDFTESDLDPISAFWRARGRQFFIRVPLSDIRHTDLLAFKCDRSNQSPYLRTLVEYADGTCTTYAGSWLETVHRHYHPRSAAELMGIENPSCPELASAPPSGALLPWNTHSPREQAPLWQSMIVRENRKNRGRLGYEAGDKVFGPTSKQKGELECQRLVRVFESIKSRGYIRNEFGVDNIGAFILLSDDDMKPKFLCVAGQHRLAALAALGYEHVDLQIRNNVYGGIFRRSEARYWAPVQAGYLTVDEATALFDRIYRGDPPAGFTRAMSEIASPDLMASAS